MENIYVATRNVRMSCGGKFLKNGRIVYLIPNDIRFYRNIRRYQNEDSSTLPMEREDIPNYFRKAGQIEIDAFMQGIESINEINIERVC